MAEPLFGRIPVEYGGLFASDHLIDVQALGLSLQGLGKLGNSVVHFYLSGEVIHDPRLYQVRVFAGPPKRGSVLYDIMALMVNHQLPLYAPQLCEMAEKFIPLIVRGVVDVTIGRKSDVNHVVDKFAEIAAQHIEFARQVHEGHMRDKAWLQEHIAMLAEQQRAPLRQLVNPVGRSCRQIKFGDENITEAAVVDEAQADVIESKDDVELGDMRQLKGVLEAVDTITGSCKILLDNSDDVLRGKITDPALSNKQNIYTHSLDTKQPIIISAKPVTKDGKIVRLFISDGHPVK